MAVGRKPGGAKTGGRKKGTPNKLTASAKEAFALAFQGIGGVSALEKWARDNQTDFYKLYARLIPQELTGEGGGPLTIQIVDFKREDCV